MTVKYYFSEDKVELRYNSTSYSCKNERTGSIEIESNEATTTISSTPDSAQMLSKIRGGTFAIMGHRVI